MRVRHCGKDAGVTSSAGSAGFEASAGGLGVLEPIEPQHGKPLRAGDRADLADIDVAHHDRAPRGRRRPVETHFQNPLARRFAEMHAGDDLLAGIAALLEIDAVQPIEIGIMHEGVAIGKIDTALRHAERDAMRLIGRLAASSRSAKRCRRGDEPEAQRRRRADRRKRCRAKSAGTGLAPDRRDSQACRSCPRSSILARSFVQIELLDEIGDLRADAIEQAAGLRPFRERHDEEIEQKLALRRSNSSIAGLAGRMSSRLLVTSRCRKTSGFAARNLDDAAVGEKACALIHEVVPSLRLRPIRI